MVKGMPIIPTATRVTTETETRMLRVATARLEAITTMVEGTTIIQKEFVMMFGKECPKRQKMHITGRLDMILSQKPGKITTMVVIIQVSMPNLRLNFA